MKRAASIAWLAIASPCLGQSFTQIEHEVSADAGASWGSRVDVLPGAVVEVRIRIRLIDVPTNPPSGLAGITFQPTLSDWHAAEGDVRVPFTNEATGAMVPDGPGAYGRIAPFGSAGQGPLSQSGLLTSFNDPGNMLRFAASKCTTMTTNLSWGVGSAQMPRELIGTSFNTSLSPLVFKYAVQLSPTRQESRNLIASTPVAGVANGRSAWYTGALSSLLAPVRADLIQIATIHVIPSPAGLLLFTAAGMYTRTRRRGVSYATPTQLGKAVR